MNQLEQVIQHLRLLSTGLYIPSEIEYGICAELYSNFNNFILYKEVVFYKWEHYSGNEDYPISDPTNEESCPEYEFLHSPDLWIEPTAYNNLRKEFCLWCAEQLEKRL